MSQLNFWQKNFTYPADSYILDGVGNIQYTAAGGRSGSQPPPWIIGITTDNTVTWVWQGFGGKSTELQKPNPTGPFTQNIVDVVSVGPNAKAIPMTGPDGLIDPSLLPPASGGITPPAGDIGGTTASPTVVSTHLTSPLPVAQGGTGTASPGLVEGSNITITGSWPNQTINASGGGGGGSFADLTSGTNTQATMVVGSGAKLTSSGTGIVDANSIGGVPVSPTAPTNGEMLIFNSSLDEYVPGLPPASLNIAKLMEFFGV